MAMGILGKYVARTYMKTKRRPKYFIKDSNLKLRRREKEYNIFKYSLNIV